MTPNVASCDKFIFFINPYTNIPAFRYTKNMLYSKRLILFLFVSLLGSTAFATQHQDLTTYFQYSEQDIAALQEMTSDFHITKKNLKKWDEYITEIFQEAPASFTKFRLCTYLYVAQNDAAALSFRAKGDFVGTLDSLSYAVIQLFFPDAIKNIDVQEDEYSKVLSKAVFEKIRVRKQEEDDRQELFQVPKELKSDYFVGLDLAKWLPWYTIPTKAYWPPSPPPPNDKMWKNELKKIREEQNSLTEEKKQAIYLWAGMQDPEKSDWRVIANTYLFSNDIPLEEVIQVRFILMVGLYDAFIVSFQAKYNYLVLRPSMRDPTLHPEIAVPKHPSYPSNHSLTSALAATVLSYFFPSEASHWHELANRAGLSRIWGGIHYPLDDREGQKAGREIGQDLLKKILKQPIQADPPQG